MPPRRPPTVIALRHVPSEDLGLLEPLLVARGFAVRYVDTPLEPARASAEDDDDDADLVVVLGGPIGANDEVAFPFLTGELELLEDRLARDRPTLGICLGAQLIARVLGARVYPAPAEEIGFLPIRLTREGEASALGALATPDDRAPVVLHWHGDTFDVPRGATRLAGSDLCPNQAFERGRALALQFHIEVDPGRLEPWLVANVHSLRDGGIDPVDLRREAAARRAELTSRSRAALAAWLDQVVPVSR